MDLAHLIEQLASPSVAVRIDAVRALATIRSAEVFDALGAALADNGRQQAPGSEPDFTPWTGGGWDAVVFETVAGCAANGLSSAGAAALPALRRALNGNGAKHAAALIAAIAPGELREVPVVEREATLHALASDWVPGNAHAETLRAAADHLRFSLESPDAHEPLNVLRTHPDDAQRALAATALRDRVGDPEVGGALFDALVHPTFWRIRAAAAEVLAARDANLPRDRLETLGAALRDSRLAGVRSRMISLVASHRVKSAASVLRELVCGQLAPQQSNRRVGEQLRDQAVDALRSLGAPDASETEQLAAAFLNPASKGTSERSEIRRRIMLSVEAHVLIVSVVQQLARPDSKCSSGGEPELRRLVKEAPSEAAAAIDRALQQSSPPPSAAGQTLLRKLRAAPT